MERKRKGGAELQWVDFAPVMEALRRYLYEDLCSNQMTLIYDLFEDFACDSENFDFDTVWYVNGSKDWLRSALISAFLRSRPRKTAGSHAEAADFSHAYGRPMAVQDVRELLIRESVLGIGRSDL